MARHSSTSPEAASWVYALMRGEKVRREEREREKVREKERRGLPKRAHINEG
jgi:hypothetical protein